MAVGSQLERPVGGVVPTTIDPVRETTKVWPHVVH
jgi:hypothetical protein